MLGPKAVDASYLPALVWGRLSKRGQLGDRRMNTIHGRYAHPATGIKMLWMSILDSYATYAARFELAPWSELEWNSLFWVLRDHMIAMNVPADSIANDWRDELSKHRAMVRQLKYRTWPVATAVANNALEDYLQRFPENARRPLRQLLAVSCPEDMIDGMGYRQSYPDEKDFAELKRAVQSFHRSEASRVREPHSLCSHFEIGGWRPRPEAFGANQRGSPMPHLFLDEGKDGPTLTVPSDFSPGRSGGVCPVRLADTTTSSSPNIARASQDFQLRRANFDYLIEQPAVVSVDDVMLPKNILSVTLDEVALHCTAETGYWVSVGAFVYDITLSVLDDLHPGGKAILLKYAGRDATAAFRAHSEEARIVACNFIVARLEGHTGGVKE